MGGVQLMGKAQHVYTVMGAELMMYDISEDSYNQILGRMSEAVKRMACRVPLVPLQ